MNKRATKFGSDLMQALKEVQAHRRGEIHLPTQKVELALATQQTLAIISAPKIDRQIKN